MQALGEQIPQQLWEIFLNKQPIDTKEVYLKRDDTNNYFLIDRAIEKNNLAETALISIILLQSEKGLEKELYSLYKGVNGLYSAGLEKYAREYAIEQNFNFLAK